MFQANNYGIKGLESFGGTFKSSTAKDGNTGFPILGPSLGSCLDTDAAFLQQAGLGDRDSMIQEFDPERNRIIAIDEFASRDLNPEEALILKEEDEPFNDFLLYDHFIYPIEPAKDNGRKPSITLTHANGYVEIVRW